MVFVDENIDLDELAESHGVSLSQSEQSDDYGYQYRVVASSKSAIVNFVAELYSISHHDAADRLYN